MGDGADEGVEYQIACGDPASCKCHQISDLLRTLTHTASPESLPHEPEDLSICDVGMNPKLPVTCTFCGRQFARSDALKRHWKTCRVRKNRALAIPTLKTKTRGRKLRACDQCNQLKRACTSTQPCRPCELRNQDCTYARSQVDHATASTDQEENGVSYGDVMLALNLDTHELAFETLEYGSNNYTLESTSDDVSTLVSEPSSNPEDLAMDIDCWSGSWNLFDEHTLATTIHVRPTRLDFNLLIQFPFLDNFTKSTGFITSFKCGTKARRLLIATESASADSLRHLQSPERHDLDRATHWTEIARRALTLDADSRASDASITALLPMTHEIVSRIRDVTVTKHRQSPVDMIWSNSLEALCYEFFHPNALQRHLALFWSCWYPNWPTLHRPTFDVTARAPALVAAMALMGAFLSPNDRDHATSQVWLNAIEELVFSDGLFMDHDVSNVWQKSSSALLRQPHLDILQAAYCVCLYQTWEGCKRSKRRILRQRFNDLVYLARDVGLAHASLRSIDTSHLSAFDWDEYVLRESLIRVCSYICNLDASYALFFRNPPRMTVSELVMELASPEPCFQARSREECFIELRTWRCRSGLGSQGLTILTAVEALSDPAKLTASSARQLYSQLSVLNMFTLVHALYLLVHHIQTTGIRSSFVMDTNPVAIALRQWKDLWSSSSRDAELIDLVRKESQTSTAWQSIGFIKHAPEYWLLAHLSLQRLTTSSAGASTALIGTVSNCEDIDMREARTLISELKDMTDNLPLARMRN